MKEIHQTLAVPINVMKLNIDSELPLRTAYSISRDIIRRGTPEQLREIKDELEEELLREAGYQLIKALIEAEKDKLMLVPIIRLSQDEEYGTCNERHIAQIDLCSLTFQGRWGRSSKLRHL